MRYLALAADYDGTLTMSGSLSAEVEGALERLRSSGRRVVLVTGRTFEEFAAACSNMALVRLRRAGERGRSLLTVDASD